MKASVDDISAAKYLLENNGYVGVYWTVEDIKHQAVQDGEELTDLEADEVKEYLAHKFDANEGINWETISLAINHIKN